MKQEKELKEKFRQLYGADARLYRAPGRVNLIGEHTDYNDGYVMPAAIGFSTWVALSPRDDRQLSIYSENFSESIIIDLSQLSIEARRARAGTQWSDYVGGVALILEQAGYRLRGANMLISGEVPIGSGLSSSAAIEVSTGYALLETAGYTVDRVQLATLCQRAENEYVGIRCGIMDQFISCNGKEGHALLLDCRSLDYRLLPLAQSGMGEDSQSGDVRLVVCNTMVKHQLASSEYNRRRAECEAGVEHFARFIPGVRALRDVAPDDLERFGTGLPDVIYRRCRHVITENARAIKAAAALERGDLNEFGKLMGESHRSLRDDYEVSCDELDLMVDLASQIEGVYGSRMMGGGFGGCTINLVEPESVEYFERTVAAGYQQATGHIPEIYICTAAAGAGRVSD